MTEYAYVHEPGAMLQERPAALPWISILVGIFIVLAISVAYMEGVNYVVKGLGGLLAAAYAIRALRVSLRPNAEMLFLGLWALWALMGRFAAIGTVVFWSEWFTICQMWILIVILSGFTDSRKVLSFNLGAFLVGAVIIGGFSMITGEFRRAEVEGYRVASFMGTNTFGVLMVLSTVALAYFWMRRSRWPVMKYLLVGSAMVAVAMATVMTGSRKAILGVGLFYPIWLFTCYRKEAIRRPLLLFAMMGVLAFGMYSFFKFTMTTAAGERLTGTYEFLRYGEGKGSGEVRLKLYREAFETSLKHPIVGVGLDNFLYFYSSIGRYTHSDIMEVTVSTGFPGVAIYLCIFVALWIRAGRVAKYAGDLDVARIARLVRAAIIILALVSLGKRMYSSKGFWIIIGAFTGYTTAMWNQIRARREYLVQDESPTSTTAHQVH